MIVMIASALNAVTTTTTTKIKTQEKMNLFFLNIQDLNKILHLKKIVQNCIFFIIKINFLRIIERIPKKTPSQESSRNINIPKINIILDKDDYKRSPLSL